MKLKWTRRQLLLKALLATGAAVGARLSGLVPELAFAAQPGNRRPDVTPVHAAKPVSQAELEGLEKQALLTRVAASDDLRELSAQLHRSPSDLAKLDVLAVRHRLADGREVVAVAGMLDEHHVFSHYEASSPRPGEPSTYAFVYDVSDPETGRLVAASAGGHAIRRSQEPATAPADGAFAYSWCPYCFSPCNPACCGVNWSSAVQCCAVCSWPCRFWPACYPCILTWCMYCVWSSCSWCNTQCCFNGCRG